MNTYQPTMKIYQPMLYVGLGGTGCLVGTELERRLREELCGPDGAALAEHGRRERFQLPDCLQFVYADYSQAEINRLPHMAADQSLRAAYNRTSRAAHDLLPPFDSSPAATQMLRMVMHDEVRSWLPPRAGEPEVAPLRDGAGQLPTVGRAALYATLRDGLDPVMAPVAEAIDRLARSAADLRQLGGRDIMGVDVFVAFSVAGGTGAGIFYDYLHLIAEAFKVKGLRAKIYPLVVMPKAFPAARGGGREAELNGARALVDLFRLIDDQNSPKTSDDISDSDGHGVSVLYPGGRRVRIPSATIQTAFLFSPTVGVRPIDLRRSLVSLVISLVATEADNASRNRSRDDSHSFAASFVNRALRRTAASPSGIGHRGVSTSLVASMTAPVNELAELLAARLLAFAVRGLTDPARRVREDNAPLVKQMFDGSSISEIWAREPLALSPEPHPAPKGASAITNALAARSEEMLHMLNNLERSAGADVAAAVRRFNPRQGMMELLKDNDIFRLDRLLNGRREDGRDDEDVDPVAAAGFFGMLLNRRSVPERPAGVQNEPPRGSRIKGRVLGVVRPHWRDPAVQELLEEQDRWYRWRARRIWHEHWKEYESRWRPLAETTVADLEAIVEAFRRHMEGEAELFARRRDELYVDRTGVSYLLPARADLKEFYNDVLERLRRQANLPDAEDEAGLMLELVQHADWRQAVETGLRDPAGAVMVVKGVLEQRIKQLFTQPGSARERPLLPPLSDLLGAAAGDRRAADGIDQRTLNRFQDQLAALLPGGFVPEGSGPLTVLISYPGTQAEDDVRRMLREELQLPRGEKYDIDFRPGASHSITVVLSRSEMSLTEVPEVREILRCWARARRDPGAEDYLAWRQRTGWQDDWLASTRDDRIHILHRLLCVLWDGRIDVAGDPVSPDRIQLRLGDENARGLTTLKLEGYDRGLSSWAGLLHAYEDWALLDAGAATQEFTRKLMEARPAGVDRAPNDPSPLYLRLVHEVAPEQVDRIERLSRELGEDGDHWLAPLREFWTDTLPSALDFPFPNATARVRRNLRELERVGTRPGPAEDETGPMASQAEALPAQRRYDEESIERRPPGRSEPYREPSQAGHDDGRARHGYESRHDDAAWNQGDDEPYTPSESYQADRYEPDGAVPSRVNGRSSGTDFDDWDDEAPAGNR